MGYWDNAASTNQVNKLSLLTNVERCHINFGTQFLPTVATHCGFNPSSILPYELSFSFWGPTFKYNLLSLGYLQKCGCTYATDPNHLRVNIYAPDGSLIDSPMLSRSFMLPISPAGPARASTRAVPAPPATVRPRPPSSLISLRAADKLNAAELLHHQYGHPSDGVLRRAIINGSIETTVTAADITANRALRGPCPGCAAGKTKAPSHPTTTYPKPPYPGHTLSMDLHDLDATAAGGATTSVRCIDLSTGFISVAGALTKSKADVLYAIAFIVSTAYNAFGVDVKRIWTDSDPSFKTLQPELALLGIELKLYTPEVHARHFERYTQTIEMRANATLLSLPYVLPKQYYLHLTASTAAATNALPNSRCPTSCPYTTVTGQPSPTPKAIFGGVYYVATSPGQRVTAGLARGTPPKNVDRAVPAVCLGRDPVDMSAQLFLLPNKKIVPRVPIGPALHVIPVGFTPKPRHVAPLVEHVAVPAAALPFFELAWRGRCCICFTTGWGARRTLCGF